jgi:hypothetical protein
MDGKLRNRPTMFMNSVRPKSAVFKFKVWPQKRSQNLSCNPAQTLFRNLPISRVLEGEMTWNLVGGRKRQFPTTCMKKICSKSDGNNDISSRQELEVYPLRPPTALLSITLGTSNTWSFIVFGRHRYYERNLICCQHKLASWMLDKICKYGIM